MSHLGKYIMQRSAHAKILIRIFKGQRKTFSSSSINFEEYQTMTEVKENLIKILNIEPSFTQPHKSREDLLKYLVKSQADLPVRKMKASFDQAIIPLSKDLELRDKYITLHGNVRFGRLIEDLDMMAVWCAVKHIYGDKKPGHEPFPYIVVTLRVDDIEIFTDRTQTTSDIRLSGHVSWVGKSSIEVYVWMDQLIQGKWKKILRALFVMAARNSVNNGPAIVNQVEGETDEEKELLRGGEERRKKRSQLIKESLLTTVPTTEELNLIHQLFKKTVDPNDVFLHHRVLPPNGRWMHDASLTTLILCHPEHRNVYNKIFGGFLIRQALELAWCLAATYGVKIPKLIHISDISFYSPVELGSLLKLYAGVTYTEEQYLQVFVYAEAYTLSNLSGKSTTSFNFTYALSKVVQQVYPSTYLDAMRYIDGRRRFLQVTNQSVMGVK